jgi:hypothetical protein
MESGALACNLHMGKDMTLPGEKQPFSPENNLAQLLMQAHANGKREAYEDAAKIVEDWFTLAPRYRTKEQLLAALCAKAET